MAITLLTGIPDAVWVVMISSPFRVDHSATHSRTAKSPETTNVHPF